ncbi:protein transport protein SEC31-like [Bombyx mandarina]|uniref:Protein transport protein SEC31-like n=1 Tax=Bombyx mandarina TaxID=7092 RepID=A0A6J2JNK6_BOMMA|nr:protein transport protein SEC31-like [Bombyx mandarina]
MGNSAGRARHQVAPVTRGPQQPTPAGRGLSWDTTPHRPRNVQAEQYLSNVINPESENPPQQPYTQPISGGLRGLAPGQQQPGTASPPYGSQNPAYLQGRVSQQPSVPPPYQQPGGCPQPGLLQPAVCASCFAWLTSLWSCFNVASCMKSNVADPVNPNQAPHNPPSASSTPPNPPHPGATAPPQLNANANPPSPAVAGHTDGRLSDDPESVSTVSGSSDIDDDSGSYDE